jgi:WD40 repeat protein
MIEQRLQIRRGDAVRWQELQPSLTETSSTTPEPIFESQWPWVISPIDQKIYVGSRTGRIDIRHAKPLKNILYSKSFRGHNGEITKLAISSDGKTLYSGGVDGTVRIWDLKTRKMINYLQERTIVGTPVKALAISLDEKTATFSTSNDTMVVILDPKTKTILDRKTIYRLRPPNPRLTGHGLQLVPEIATSLAFSPDGLTLFLSEGDSTIVVWNKKSAKIIYRLESPQSHITALTVSPDGKTLYSDAADKTRRSWNIPSSVMPEEDPR